MTVSSFTVEDLSLLLASLRSSASAQSHSTRSPFVESDSSVHIDNVAASTACADSLNKPDHKSEEIEVLPTETSATNMLDPTVSDVLSKVQAQTASLDEKYWLDSKVVIFKVGLVWTTSTSD